MPAGGVAGGSRVKNCLPVQEVQDMQEVQVGVQSLGQEDPWRQTEDPSGCGAASPSQAGAFLAPIETLLCVKLRT